MRVGAQPFSIPSLPSSATVIFRPVIRFLYFFGSTCSRHFTRSSGTISACVRPQQIAPPMLQYRRYFVEPNCTSLEVPDVLAAAMFLPGTNGGRCGVGVFDGSSESLMVFLLAFKITSRADSNILLLYEYHRQPVLYWESRRTFMVNDFLFIL